MIDIKCLYVGGFQEAIHGMRNPMNSWDKSDSCEPVGNVGKEKTEAVLSEYENAEAGDFYILGPNDKELAMTLAKAGSVHGKFRRMIIVYVDILAPLYWWKEFDTYKVGTVANSCSTMHKIHSKKFEEDDFSFEHLIHNEMEDPYALAAVGTTLSALNRYRELYLQTNDKKYWWQMIQLLPSSYNQKRTVMLNYEVLSNIYIYRRDHKLDEWREFCKMIEHLPYFELITCNAKEDSE